jgi:aryl-alcohol dehydrogenase-like predicted oxidoreductase
MTIARIAIAGSDVAIARVGLGCSRIFGRRELRSSARLVEAALQAGVTHFDTAPSYGNGTS